MINSSAFDLNLDLNLVSELAPLHREHRLLQLRHVPVDGVDPAHGGHGRSKLDPSLKAPCFQQLNLESAYVAFNPNPTFRACAPYTMTIVGRQMVRRCKLLTLD